ncbi:MAG: gamma carbonic anhydrase family protein [Thermoplasmata archaeon]|nr:gamma carbonic anhydrase family protein [Thermoplasmata archaeon]
MNMKPKVHESCYVDPTAVIIGDVEIAEGCSIYAGAVIRADLATIRIGPGSNIQENCVIHVSRNFPVTIGKDVSLGHCCMVHGATIHDETIIGINSVVMNGSEIGAGSIIGGNAFVREGMKIPDGSMVLGVPGKIIRSGDDGLLEKTRFNAETYHMLRDEHRAGKHERY